MAETCTKPSFEGGKQLHLPFFYILKDFPGMAIFRPKIPNITDYVLAPSPPNIKRELAPKKSSVFMFLSDSPSEMMNFKKK